jgi:hypothetical protein
MAKAPMALVVALTMALALARTLAAGKIYHILERELEK